MTRRPAVEGLRARARRHRPAIVLSTSAVLIALAGGLTGAALAGGHDEHGWEHGGGDQGRHLELDDVPGGH